MVARTVFTATTRPARDLALTIERLSQRVASTERRLNKPTGALAARVEQLEATVADLAQRLGEPPP